MRKTIKTWWRDWAAVDLLALGVAATFGYIAFRLRYPDVTSPYLEIWSNLSVGLLGAWLSVRLIDAIIQRRERRHGVRRILWGNLNHIRLQAQRLLPDLYSWSIIEFKNELMWAQERLPSRRRHLEATEIQKLDRVVDIMHKLLDGSEKCANLESLAKQQVNRIDATLDELNTARERIERQLDDLRHTGEGKLAQEAGERLQSLYREEFSLSGSEIKQLQSLAASFASGSLLHTEGAISLNELRIRNIYRHELSWLTALERLHNEFRDATDGRQQELLTELEAYGAILAEQDLPPLLKELASAYLESVRSNLSERFKLKSQVAVLTGAIDLARHDISEESELD